MRLRKVKNAKEILTASPYYIERPEEYKGNWSKYTKKDIHLEVGCGKGKFLIEMARQNPNIFFIGVEYQESVLVRAIQKLETEDIPNIKFIHWDASRLDSLFFHEIDTLYLNFSDPWPKKKHVKRRLTSENFLRVYDQILKSEKIIIQKTDNIDLFAYSLEELSKFGYTLEKVSLDLEKSGISNIKTEYEEKFMNLGYKINYVKAVKKDF